MPTTAVPLVLGWEEWIALPDLGLPAIKAKVDTGARTSALHAVFVSRLPGQGAQGAVRRSSDSAAQRRRDHLCGALGRPSRGAQFQREREERYVIATPIRIGEHLWPIEITLTNRHMMAYRMLIGRQALAGRALVDQTRPSSSQSCATRCIRKSVWAGVAVADLVPMRMHGHCKRGRARNLSRSLADSPSSSDGETLYCGQRTRVRRQVKKIHLFDWSELYAVSVLTLASQASTEAAKPGTTFQGLCELPRDGRGTRGRVHDGLP